MSDIEPGTLCERCRLHPATGHVADSVLDFAHGVFKLRCECCRLDEAIRQAEAMLNRLPQLYEDLDAACPGQFLPKTRDVIAENEKLREEAEQQWVMAHCVVCGEHYPDRNAANYAAPHPEGEHCYWPKPEVLG